MMKLLLWVTLVMNLVCAVLFVGSMLWPANLIMAAVMAGMLAYTYLEDK